MAVSSPEAFVDRCTFVIEQLNIHQHWALSLSQCREYASVLSAYLELASTDSDIERVACYYHYDHQTVEALRQTSHPEHTRIWQHWIQNDILKILRYRGVRWEGDGSSDEDDLVMIAALALVQSLPSYRYQSKFSTWAYSVVTRSVKRFIRDVQAKKRGGTQTPDVLDEAIVDQAHPVEQPVLDLMLFDICRAILQAHSDQQLIRIFELWVAEADSLSQIGKRIRMKRGEVKQTVAVIQQVLVSAPTIQAWWQAEQLPSNPSKALE